MAISLLSVYEARHSRNLVFLFLFGIYDMAVSFSSVTFHVGTPVCSGSAAAYNALKSKEKEHLVSYLSLGYCESSVKL